MEQHCEGILTTRDAKRHIRHLFEVPEGARGIEITLRFSPVLVRGAKNLLTLTLFDPRGETASGFRGAGHRDGEPDSGENGCVARVHLSATSATPGYIPGPLPAGTWTVEIDTHMVMPGPALHYTLEFTAVVGDIPRVADRPSARRGEFGGGASPSSFRSDVFAQDDNGSLTPQASAVGGPGWYRGDLHTHTDHSDARGFTVADLLQSGADAGLDFVFLTDHNTTSGLYAPFQQTGPGPQTGVGPLLCAGLELTTYWGHALCLGTRAWVDWRVAPGTGGMAGVRRKIEAAGGVFVIAHPGSVGDPTCTGCAWRFGEMMPDGAGLVEVWNGPWAGDSGNEAALALWYDWLNQGHRLIATAGTDAHGVGDHSPEGSEGRPGFSVVHAGGLSERGLLEGLKRGRCYLSAGPRVSFGAEGVGGVRWEMGETTAGSATLRCGWEGCPSGAHGRLLANGRLLDAWQCDGSGQRAWPVEPHTADWLVVEIRDATGWMLAVTNPVWVGRDR